MSLLWKQRLRFLGRVLIVWASVVATCIFLFLKEYPNGQRRSGAAISCASNCENLATAIGMYADDSHQLPAQLDQLVAGRYLKTIPTCPAAGRVTYRYEKFQSEWTINCQGDYHTGTHPDEMGNVTLEVNYPIIGSSCPLRLNSLENSPPPWRRNK